MYLKLINRWFVIIIYRHNSLAVHTLGGNAFSNLVNCKDPNRLRSLTTIVPFMIHLQLGNSEHSTMNFHTHYVRTVNYYVHNSVSTSVRNIPKFLFGIYISHECNYLQDYAIHII